MSKPKGKNPARSSQRRSTVRAYLTLAEAEARLPLVRLIAANVQARWTRLARLEREQADLERRRLNLDWPERSRRYEITDEIARERQQLQEEVTELEQVQGILVDPVQGEVAFPAVVQSRSAYFVWSLGDDRIHWWCFANEPNRRPIPPAWRKKADAGSGKASVSETEQTSEAE